MLSERPESAVEKSGQVQVSMQEQEQAQAQAQRPKNHRGTDLLLRGVSICLLFAEDCRITAYLALHCCY